MASLSEPVARVPARTVLLSIAGLWLVYFVLVTARGWVVGLELHGALLWRRVAVIVASMVVTAAFWPVLRLLERRAMWQKIAALALIALPASLLLAAINQWVFRDIEGQVVAKIGEREGLRIRRDEAGNLLVDPMARPPLPPPPPPGATVSPPVPPSPSLTITHKIRAETRWQQLTDLALQRYFLLLAWIAIYLAFAGGEQARLAERRAGEHRRAAKAAELRSLRYQVNPHFLFNTLNSLSALVITGKVDAAEAMIQQISTFYRRSLAGDPTGDLPLTEEIALQRLYLEIEAVRFPDRLRTAFDIPVDVADALVPGMILQPLIENSVKYAVAASREPVTITVVARAEHGQLVLTVSDDGPGGSAGGGHGHGIGLANVRDRLAARFGTDGSIVCGPTGKGYRTVIRIPLVKLHG